MELIMEQFPIVIHSLNVIFTDAGCFLQRFWSYSVGTGYCIWINVTFLKPLELYHEYHCLIVRGTPLMIQMLIIYYFPTGLRNPIWGGGESGRFLCSFGCIYL